ncbi:hypothetical protein [Pandoravirus japonicus]|uniref:Uncharacterized protein n=1 Tax=Pandoravirus japonicus TaxID=2823154 RepID=A0A811BPC6_9VIRU|nr:hypothetical protein [Pandoravirus japonicus]
MAATTKKSDNRCTARVCVAPCCRPLSRFAVAWATKAARGRPRQRHTPCTARGKRGLDKIATERRVRRRRWLCVCRGRKDIASAHDSIGPTSQSANNPADSLSPL